MFVSPMDLFLEILPRSEISAITYKYNVVISNRTDDPSYKNESKFVIILFHIIVIIFELLQIL